MEKRTQQQQQQQQQQTSIGLIFIIKLARLCNLESAIYVVICIYTLNSITQQILNKTRLAKNIYSHFS